MCDGASKEVHTLIAHFSTTPSCMSAELREVTILRRASALEFPAWQLALRANYGLERACAKRSGRIERKGKKANGRLLRCAARGVPRQLPLLGFRSRQFTLSSRHCELLQKHRISADLSPQIFCRP